MTDETHGTRIFGAALGRMGMPCGDIPDYLNFPHLQVMEVPADILLLPEHAALCRAIRRKVPEIICGTVMDPSVAGAVLQSASRNQLLEFAEQIIRILDILAKEEIRKVTLNPGLDSFPGGSAAEENLLYVLHRIAPALMKNRQTLLLPFRIPGAPQEVSRFLRNTLLPCVKARLDIHFCEPDVTAESAGMLLFETAALVFSYDADSGAHILKRHVQPWLDWKERFDCTCALPFLLSPFSQRQRMSFPEIKAWDELAQEFQNE